MRELGIYDRMRFSDDQLPQVATEMRTEWKGESESKGDMILSAHEVLMESTPENRKRFGMVVQMMKEKKAGSRGT